MALRTKISGGLGVSAIAIAISAVALPGVVTGQKIKLFFNHLVGADTGELVQVTGVDATFTGMVPVVYKAQRSLLDDFERCTPEAQLQLVKHAALMAKGVAPPASSAPARKPQAKAPAPAKQKKKN